MPARTRTAPVTKKATPEELLKELPQELLAVGADLAILEAFFFLRQFDENAEFKTFFKEVFDGKELLVDLPGVIVAQRCEGDDPPTLEDQARLYFDYLEALNDKPDLRFGDFLDGGEAAAPAEAGDPPASAATKANTKAATTAKKTTAATTAKKSRAKTTPAQDAEFEQQPADDGPADVTIKVSKKDAKLAADFVDMGGTDDLKPNEAYIVFTADAGDGEHTLCVAVTNPNPEEPVYFDGYYMDSTKQIVGDCDTGVASELFGRYKFTINGKVVTLDVVPSNK